MKQETARVIANTTVADHIYFLRLYAPEIAAQTAPGQFVHIRCCSTFEPLLRRPFSVHRSVRPSLALSPARLPEMARLNPGEIAILFEEVGRGTGILASVRRDDYLDVLGPLGQGFCLKPTTRNVLLVAGGLGIAPLVGLAEAASTEDRAVTVLAGAATAARVLPVDYVPAEAEYVVCTEDGSLGRRGLITDLLPEYLAWADQVFACGPTAMLRALGALRWPLGLSVQVSLEQRLACAVGACAGCRIDTKHGRRSLCRDGPVFDLSEVIWS
ncbi:MAG: dihydroorotate dehydrogenase electron transfer subunit [Chloroflexi bacterium]|nr:dihydroorotate dehydrogenase electron transfer subunit [Chloroflexota bacterium]